MIKKKGGGGGLRDKSNKQILQNSCLGKKKPKKRALTNSNVAILSVENVKIKQAIKNATVKILHSPLFHLTTIAFFFSEDDLYCISGVDAHCLKSMSNPSANSPTIKKKEKKENRTEQCPRHTNPFTQHTRNISPKVIASNVTMLK